MKTFIVLCYLITFAIASPTSLQGNFENIDSSNENFPDNKLREKKSRLHDPLQGLTPNNEMENTQIRHSQKAEDETTSPGKTKVGSRKPIIIKKKFGYHVYRDSDEEMVFADPFENCRKQFKVKLCDTKPFLHTDSNNVKSLLSDRSHKIISDKDLGDSVKMAKEAVENLERGLKRMENSAKINNPEENLDSGITMQQDIEMAKSALEYVQENMGNLESIQFQLNDPNTKETQHFKSINQWKEAINNIHKNVEIARNMEDAFNFDSQNSYHSDKINTLKTSENELSTDHNNNKKYDSEYLINENTPQSIVLATKTTQKDSSNDSEVSLISKTSSTKDEQNGNYENDMFVSTTDHTESKMNLHSESLTSENVLDKNALVDHDIASQNFNINDHLLTTKSSEMVEKNSDLKNMKMNSNIQAPEVKASESFKITTLQHHDEKNVESESLEKTNAFKSLTEYSDKHSLKQDTSSAKSNEISENTMLTKASKIKSTIHNDQEKDQLIYNPTSKSNDEIKDQNNSETKSTKIESLSSEHKKDSTQQTFSEDKKDNTLKSSHPKMSLLKEKATEDEDQNVSLTVDNNSPHQNHINVPESKSLARINAINNEERGTINAFNVHTLQVTEQNTHSSPLTAVGPREKQHTPNEFSSMRLSENDNTNSLHNENRETQDFPLTHLTQGKDHTSSHMNKDINIEEQLNDFHESFMRLAEEKQLNDILTQQLKTMTESNNDHKKHQKTNEFRNEYMPFDLMHARRHQNHNIGQQLHGNHEGLSPSKRPVNHSTQNFKSVSELYDGDMLLIPPKMNEFHGRQQNYKEQMNMRIPEGHNLGQMFIDSHEVHDPNSMRWAQEKQHIDDLGQIFNIDAETHNEPNLNDQLHEPRPIDRINNLYLYSNHDGYPMRPTMPDNFYVMKDAKSNDMDSAMQPSMHIPMRNSDRQWGHHHHHHHHHEMGRSSYSPSQSNVGATSGAMGVFSNTNTACGIPLLVSCSPSVVSGSLARAQPMGTSVPEYTSGNNLKYYKKRDANKIEGKQNIKMQNAQMHLTH